MPSVASDACNNKHEARALSRAARLRYKEVREKWELSLFSSPQTVSIVMGGIEKQTFAYQTMLTTTSSSSLSPPLSPPLSFSLLLSLSLLAVAPVFSRSPSLCHIIRLCLCKISFLDLDETKDLLRLACSFSPYIKAACTCPTIRD